MGNELKRGFLNWKFITSVLAVLALMIVYTVVQPYFFEGYESMNVFEIFYGVIYGLPIQISLILAAIPYTCSLCDDLEYRYIFSILTRETTFTFIIKRFLVIFLTAWMVMICAICLYVMIIHSVMPWYDGVIGGEYDMLIVEAGGWYDQIMKKNEFLFFLVFALQYGMLSGVLALIAANISIVCPNRLLTLSAPFLVIYILNDLSSINSMAGGRLDLWQIYNILYNVMKNDKISFFYSIIFTIIVGIILCSTGRLLLERKLRHV